MWLIKHVFTLIEENHKKIEVLFWACGAIIGLLAYIEYRKDNAVSMFIKLDEQERKLTDQIDSNDYLNTFWATYKDKNMNTKALSDAKLVLIIRFATKNVNDNAQLKWENISELDDLIWASEAFGKPEYEILRKAYSFAESMMFLADSAFYAKSENIISNEVYECYTTYIDDVGDHPLYLEAVYWAHDQGIITKSFAAELQRRYLSNPKLKKTALAIYPAIINDQEWVAKVGINKMSNNRMH